MLASNACVAHLDGCDRRKKPQSFATVVVAPKSQTPTKLNVYAWQATFAPLFKSLVLAMRPTTPVLVQLARKWRLRWDVFRVRLMSVSIALVEMRDQHRLQATLRSRENMPMTSGPPVPGPRRQRLAGTEMRDPYASRCLGNDNI